jgi:hypothetical protein
VPTLIIVRVGLGLSVQSVESSVKTAASMSEEDSRRKRRPIFGMPYSIDKEMPSIPGDVEKGGASYGTGTPHAF